MKKKYLVLKDYIFEHLKDYDKFKAIPSERDYAKMFQINRMTVRKAIDELIYEGFLYRKARSGTYIVTETQEKKTDDYKILSFTKNENGLFKTKVLLTNDDCSRFRVVKYHNQLPIMYEDHYFSNDYFELDKNSYLDNVDSILNRYQNQLQYDDEILSFLSLEKVSKILKIEQSSPMIQVRRRYYLNEQIIAFSRIYYHANNYTYKTEKNRY